ncbi:hypothetical protein AAFA70_000235 [Enterococcus faecalis]
MELEQKVKEHEKRLGDHDREIGRLDRRTMTLQEQLNANLVRLDESNKFLREQNMKQMEQNSEILNAILNRNSEADERKDELKKLNTENIWKIILAIFVSSGAITILFNWLSTFLGGAK